jgi:hypothetical protein
MSDALPNFEGLLREALSPVEPPEDLVLRLESTLRSITELAADELQEWELSAMRDPRNWARPAAAVVAGGAAGVGLVLLRARQHAHEDVARGGLVGGARGTAERAERALKEFSRETRDRLLRGR